MTAVVGLVHKGRVHLGADSALVGGSWNLTISAQSKVFHAGPYVIGTSGSTRFAQILRYAFEPPAPTGDLHRLMVTGFVDAMRATLKEHGATDTGTSRESTTDSSFALVGVHGRLFEIQSDYQVQANADEFAAIGCGFDLALGALHATERLPRMAPRRRLSIALEAAERFSAGVASPFAYVSTRLPDPT